MLVVGYEACSERGAQVGDVEVMVPSSSVMP